MYWFHSNWFWVSVITTGAVGLWGLALALLKREPDRPFLVARSAAVGAMLLQVAAGVWLWTVDGRRPGNGFHVFYGVVISFTLAFAYVYRSQLARRQALGYGLLLLFVMGLGLRAWSNVG